jgi:hypothetical protein
MKKYIYILAALSMIPTAGFAQSLESDVDAELDQVVAPQSVAAPAAPTVAAPAAVVGNSAPVSGQPIYILNQATPTSTATSQSSNQTTQSAVQKQPTTVIEATPLTESRAEAIRRSRQDAELQTEQRIVEKLEMSRMEDEKKRANVLFGDKLETQYAPVQQAPVVAPVVVQPVQPVQVQQAPVVAAPVVVPVQQVQEPKENTRDIIREELAAAMKAEVEAVPAPTTKYVAGILGIGDYPDTRNVKGNYALGVAFGNKVDSIIIEGAFLYSNYTKEDAYYYNPYWPSDIDVDQYSGALAAKVQLFDGVVKPVFGGLVQYSYRKYSWSDSSYNYYNDETADSHAIDIGAIAGADLEFSPKYSIGFDFRYLWNLSSRVNDKGNQFLTPQYGTQLEKLSYWVSSIVARVNF